jgi:hypothetical protein
MISELMGYDIDWFAIDDDGMIGIFFAAGSTSIPKSAVENIKEHAAIARGFVLPKLGSLNVWKDYARYGLYVYDFHFFKLPTGRAGLGMARHNSLISFHQIPT